MTAIETSGSDEEVGSVTVGVAVPATTVPLGWHAWAEMVEEPAERAVATPVLGLMEAIPGLLEVQVAALMVDVPTVADWPVRLIVAPEPVVPMAMKLTV